MNDTTLILSFHPDLSGSRANRSMLEAVKDIQGITVVDLYGVYPSDQVDTALEAQRLMSAKRLVLQFPVQWYSTPALLKTWQASVLTQMYCIAYETQGRRLGGIRSRSRPLPVTRPRLTAKPGAICFRSSNCCSHYARRRTAASGPGVNRF